MTPDPIQRLVVELAKLPGIGEKTAQRLAFYILKAPKEYARDLSRAIAEVVDRVRLCSVCCALTEDDPCALCKDATRDGRIVCVVESVADMLAVERTREFRGRYHVLGGAISPIDGIGPDDLRIRQLLTRLNDGTVTEVIIATDPNLEGEATATYLTRLLVQPGLRVTRLASGLPVGGDLEYADEVTLGRAFEGRRLVEN